MKKLISVILILSIFSLNAQEKRSPAAVNELFKTMKMEVTYQQTIEKMLDVQIQQNPAIKPLRGTMLKFFKKHMGWESMKNDMAKIYMDKFTDSELKELNDFYKTPIGQKAAILVPTLTAEGAALGQKRVQENMAELQQMIREKMAEDKKKNQ